MININAFLETYYSKDEKIILACSAGPDSIFLLYKILETEFRKNLVVCYFNHKTRVETDEEEAFLEKLGKKEGFQVEVASCDFTKLKELYPSKSFEELAREKRYQFFDAILQIHNSNKVILGHHLDDKIETFFFNLARGTKLSGLINMREHSGVILRPLLGMQKEEILEFLEINNLTYFLDQTNSDTRITRNKLRHDILPQFANINTSYKKNIQNIMNYFEELELFIQNEVENFVEEEKSSILNNKRQNIYINGYNNYFTIVGFNKKTIFLQKEIIKYIYYIGNNRSTIGLSEKNIDEVIRFINGKNNKTEKQIQKLLMKKENTIILY